MDNCTLVKDKVDDSSKVTGEGASSTAITALAGDTGSSGGRLHNREAEGVSITDVYTAYPAGVRSSCPIEEDRLRNQDKGKNVIPGTEYGDGYVPDSEPDDSEDDTSAESLIPRIIESLGGSRYWMPIVSPDILPVEGAVYATFEEDRGMYDNYAEKAGFSTRLATIKRKKGEITHRYIICSKAEAYNHSLLEGEDKQFSKARRRLQYAEKSGGHSQVHGTVEDFCNFKRDMNIFIGLRDAQMLIDKLIWADEVSKQHYKIFNDVVAFVATYRTNRMVFVPFIGVDHHKRTVCFGGALMKTETADSYKWELRAFLEAHRSQPKLVLTDQDPAVKITVASTFTQSSHRLCMWHNMDKLPMKFMICFESTMDDQRYNQRKLDIKTNSSSPMFMTNLAIERHAISLYTHEVFSEVQSEIWKGDTFCAIKNIRTKDDYDVFIIIQSDMSSNVVHEMEVVSNNRLSHVECACLNFLRIGYLCKHVFFVYKYLGILTIPDQYILRQWRTNSPYVHPPKTHISYTSASEDRDALFVQAIGIVESCVALLWGDLAKMANYVNKLLEMRTNI